MKLKIDVYPKYDTKTVSIPKAYRSNILSLFKEAFKQGEYGEEFYKRNYEKNISKPFTFSTYFPNLKQSENHFFDFGSEFFTIYYSTSDFSFLARLYEGIKAIKGFSPFTFPVTYKLTLLEDREVFSETMIYKTMSPIVVREFEGGKTSGYLLPNDDNFSKNLKYAIKNYNHYFDNISARALSEMEIEPLKTNTTKVFFKEHLIPCTNGLIKITAHPLVQKMIYNAGLGSRRSQGFGMLEVIECTE
jgi:CRISPR-associated endoribonuclease Cas6